MNKFTPFFALIGMIALTGCPEPINGTDDTDGGGTVDCTEDTFPANGPLSAGDYVDCAPYTGDTVISYFPQPTCSGDTWGYDVETKGTAAGVNLLTYDYGDGSELGQYGEDHNLTDGATEANGWWDAFELDLDVVGAGQTDNESTFHQCTANNNETLIFAYEALDAADSTQRADCVVVIHADLTILREEKTTAFYDYHSAASLSGCDEVDGWTAE